MRRLCTAVVVACLLSSALAAGPSDFFSKKDSVDAVASLKASQNPKTGVFGSGIQDTYFAVATLLSLDAEVPKSDLICAFAQKCAHFSLPRRPVSDALCSTPAAFLLRCVSVD